MPHLAAVMARSLVPVALVPPGALAFTVVETLALAFVGTLVGTLTLTLVEAFAVLVKEWEAFKCPSLFSAAE